MRLGSWINLANSKNQTPTKIGFGVWFLVLGMCLVAAPARGQSTQNLLGSLGNFPRANQPIDLSNVVAPTPQPSPAFRLTNLFPSSTLIRLFPGLSRNPKPAAFSTSPLPAPSTFPSTKYPNSFVPTAPFFPKQGTQAISN